MRDIFCCIPVLYIAVHIVHVAYGIVRSHELHALLELLRFTTSFTFLLLDY